MTRSTTTAALLSAATLLLTPAAFAQSSPVTAGSGTGTDGRADRPVPPCIVPKVERGAAVAETRRALRRSGCSTATRRVRSSAVAKGRVVGLSERSGARLKPVEKVVIRVSRGR